MVKSPSVQGGYVYRDYVRSLGRATRLSLKSFSVDHGSSRNTLYLLWVAVVGDDKRRSLHRVS